MTGYCLDKTLRVCVIEIFVFHNGAEYFYPYEIVYEIKAEAGSWNVPGLRSCGYLPSDPVRRW